MHALSRSLPRAGGLAAALFAFVFAGCSSDRSEYARRGPPPPPPPPLAGHEVFFDGQILAEIQTGAGFGDSGKVDNPSANGGGGRHGGGGRMGGGRHGRGGGGGGSPDSPSVDDTIEQEQIANIRRAAASGGPPMMIHLRFTNHGATHVDVSVVDFLSELGNFVVQPDKLALDPGQMIEVDPMTSRLTAEAGQATITLVLHAGGHTEKKTLTLTPVTPPPGTPAPAATPNTPPAGT
ncbi:MAG TPA: hypothetical protein VHD32_06420 [Candidatus Didemnitutus sp.]|nr:hypothetical protein [Candidatus Didemnitutus sp.]